MRSSTQPLRVAVVSSSLRLAGAEKQTIYFTRALAECGVDVLFVHLGEGGYYEEVLRRMGIPVTQIHKPNQPFYILSRLVRTLRGFRPEIVFSPQFGDLMQAGIGGRLSGALILGGVRSDGFYELNSNGYRSAWMMRLAHGLIVNSHRAWQNLASHGVDAAKLRILPNVLDLGEFDRRSKMPPPISLLSDRVMAVAVGSLQPCKRFDRFLNALALARRKAPALLGVLAGADDGCRSKLERQARELGLAPEHVVFLGECENIPALLSQAAFLVLSSEYEGFPNVLLEAMAARLPVITTPVGDADRIVMEGRTGHLVDGAEVEIMAARMVDLAIFKTTRERMGTAGRNRVEHEFCYENLPGRLLAMFREFARLRRKTDLAARVQLCSPEAEANQPSETCSPAVSSDRSFASGSAIKARTLPADSLKLAPSENR